MSSENIGSQEPTVQPTVILGFEVPDNAADTRDWYSHAADTAAMYAEDDNSRKARNARQELAAARQAMELASLRHGGPAESTEPAETESAESASSQHIGIEEARKVLGDLVTAAQQGTDIILTRNRRPVARITRHQDDTMTDNLAAEFQAEAIAALSPETRAAVAALVDRRIELEHGTADNDQVKGCRLIAASGIQVDIRRPYVLSTGGDRSLVMMADLLLRHLVDEGLAARLCHCAQMHPHGCPHGAAVGQLFCGGHYEADVPAIDGALLCGTCHIAEHQARS